MEKNKNLTKNSLDTLIIKKNGSILFKSQEKGLIRLYKIIKNKPNLLNNVEVFDTVVGQAAAMIYVKSGINELVTPLISEGALKILENEDLELHYSKIVPVIYNRKKTDLCPMEKIARKSPNYDTLMDNLEVFFHAKK